MRLLAPALLLGLLSSCSDDGYKLTYACAVQNQFCTPGRPCPQVPLGKGGCEDTPELLGHPSIHVEAGVVVGCRVALPFGNPARDDSQVICDCKLPEGAAVPAWTCPL